MQNKSEMINRIAELAEENAKLNAIIDSYQPKIQALKDENYGLNQELLGYKKGVQAAEIIELKAENERLNRCMIETLHHEGDSLRKTIKYKQTLQEIKEIAEGIRNATYQFGQEADQKFFNETLGKILQKITKAEEE